MYLHSFQSYLWNFAASHRVATHGVEAPVIGDLVLPKDTDAEPAGQSSLSQTTKFSGFLTAGQGIV